MTYQSKDNSGGLDRLPVFYRWIARAIIGAAFVCLILALITFYSNVWAHFAGVGR